MNLKRYFDNYKDAREFMEKLSPEQIVDYGRKKVLDEAMYWVEYIYNPA